MQRRTRIQTKIWPLIYRHQITTMRLIYGVAQTMKTRLLRVRAKEMTFNRRIIHEPEAGKVMELKSHNINKTFLDAFCSTDVEDIINKLQSRFGTKNFFHKKKLLTIGKKRTIFRG